MAEEKKYTLWNGNDWATNDILSEDKLRLADLSMMHRYYLILLLETQMVKSKEQLKTLNI